MNFTFSEPLHNKLSQISAKDMKQAEVFHTNILYLKEGLGHWSTPSNNPAGLENTAGEL